LTREFADAANATAPSGEGPLNYQVINSRAGLDDLIKSLWEAESVGIAIPDSSSPENPESPAQQPSWGGNGDKEPIGKGEDVADLLCEADYDVPQALAFSTAEATSALVDFRTFADGRESAIASLREVLSNGLIEKSVHDLKRVVGLLDRLGTKIEGVKDDTFLAAYLLDPNRSKYELADLAREAVGVESIEKPNQGWTDSQWQAAVAADLTRRTAKVLHQRILEKKLETIYSEMELPLAPLLFQMERAGLKVDRATLADLSSYLGLELKKLTVKIYELAGREFNIGSPKQVGEVLSELDMASGRKTSTGRVSTSKAVLEELAQTHELPKLIIDYRELDKLKSVYTDALPHQIAADGRIHCLLNQTVAATGRLS